jgi:uncharacterized membrane protein YqgA involved in biofilm formation
MAICVVYIGIEGALETAPAVEESFLSAGLVKILITILSLGLGALVGELIDIDKWVGRLGDLVERKFAVKSGEEDSAKGRFSRGFVSCSILFCVGAMTVNGAIADASGRPDILLAKSVIDGIMCFVMATSLGFGCAFSAFFVLIYQGALTALGFLLAEILPVATVTYMSVAGSLVIVFIGTNMLGITKVKTANLVPAMFMPIPLAALFSIFV